MDKKLILIVEDDEDIQAIYKDMVLGTFDVDLVQSLNGREGVEAVKAREPDMIILDLLMPVMSGEEFLKELRGPMNLTDVPVVICSVNQTLANQLLKQKKADAVLPKLFQQEELLATVNRFLKIGPK